MNDVERILVVSRSTKECQKALHYGLSLAKQFNSKLFVLHVLDDPFSVEGWNLPLPSLKEEYENLVKKARREIDRIIKSEQAEGLEITEWIREGKPAEEVIAAVKEEKINLVIMAAHEEGRFEHFLFGRTVEELTRKMPCSILLVNYNPLHKV
jgi:nucleotide-binding universal stress UspA family protein